MTELGDDTQAAMCYPSSRQYEQWKTRAEERGYDSVSRFIIDMVEAGSKQMDISVEYDEEPQDLRRQRNDLKEELDDARRRIEALEDQLYRGERKAIIEFLDGRSDGATFAEIVQCLIDDAPTRVAEQLSQMEGDDIVTEGSLYTTRESDTDGF
jgi:predicted RNase H-like nuclease (RuvC/YqgF family)